MAVTLKDVSATLEKVIAPYVQDNFDSKNIALNQLSRDGAEYMNNAFYVPVRVTRHGGVVNLANDGNNTVIGAGSTAQGSVGVKIITGVFRISKLVLDATKTTKGAVVNELTFQAESLSDDMAKSLNRQFYSDGYGIISQVGGSVGAGTIGVTRPDSSLDDGRSIDWYGSINGDIDPLKYVTPGQVLAIGTAGADLGTVTSASGTNIVVTGAPAIVANDSIYLADGSGEGAGTSEIQGIRLALSSATSGTYAGIANSSLYGWTPQVGTTSEALTLNAMEQKYVAAREFAHMGDRYAIFMNKTLYTKYGNLLTAMRREAKSLDLVSGWTGLEFAVGGGKIAVMLDYDVPDGEVEIVNLDTWTLTQVSDLDFMEDPTGNGGKLLRIGQTIQYESTMHWFLNLMCRAPGANARLTQKSG